MKSLHVLALAATISLGFAAVGCTTSHEESDTPGLFGGNTHEETTTTHNPITDQNSTDHTVTKTP